MLRLLIGLFILTLCSQGQARSHIEIVGSSTVFPFATVVAERFGRATIYTTPTVESTGSGGGFSLFCNGLGVNTPDITNASRKIKLSELALCKNNGVDQILEVKIGYDGIVIANSKESPRFNFSSEDLFYGLAMYIPDETKPGAVVSNPFTHWSQVNPALPYIPIKMFGPPPSSGTRDAFLKLTMEMGCRTVNWVRALEASDPLRYRAICHTIREDGRYIQAGENDNLIVQKLLATPVSLGIFGFSFLEANKSKLQGSKINNVAPTVQSITSGKYSISRSLFFYVKGAHIGVVPGIVEFLNEYLDAVSLHENSYLAKRGLIPLPRDEFIETSDRISKRIYLDPQDIEVSQ